MQATKKETFGKMKYKKIEELTDGKISNTISFFARNIIPVVRTVK